MIRQTSILQIYKIKTIIMRKSIIIFDFVKKDLKDLKDFKDFKDFKDLKDPKKP